jgi:hypothetical protein
MSAQVLQQSSHMLTLSGGERDSLLDLLRQTLGEAHIELHRTHTPAFRDSVLGREAVIRALIEKLEWLGPDQTEVPSRSPVGIEEGSPVPHVVYIDDQGRFQMAVEDLEDFIRYLRDNEVRIEVEAANAFHSVGKAYGHGRLHHLFDADSVKRLYRRWKQAQGTRAAGETA